VIDAAFAAAGLADAAALGRARLSGRMVNAG
jgi:hypothetical protein